MLTMRRVVSSGRCYSLLRAQRQTRCEQKERTRPVQPAVYDGFSLRALRQMQIEL